MEAHPILSQLQESRGLLTVLATLVTVAVVDFLIIRRVWRAVNRPES